jgi:NADH dehydrogenase (ubiquinone) 1 alpha subcomplex subunit 10
MKPHLVIYLDVPVKIVKERIQKRNDANEVKSTVFTEAYLNDIENIYKQQYLKDISTHAELLVYDWSDFGETEVVVEDIERIQFDRFEKHDPKMKDWRLPPQEWAWCEARMRYVSPGFLIIPTS